MALLLSEDGALTHLASFLVNRAPHRPAGLSKRPRREDGSRQKRPGAAAGGKLRLFRNPELLPFSSVLTSYFASQDSLGKATDFTAVALEFDWMQQVCC